MKLLSRPNHWLSVFCLCGWLLTAPLTAFACQSNTDLEQLYCQQRGDDKSLPSMEDFRRNSTQIQRLLLKRSAAAAGLALPPEKKPSQETAGSSSRLVEATTPPTVNIRSAAPTLSSKPSLLPLPLPTSCQLSNRTIQCASDEFHLVENQSNHSLKADSLSDSNQLVFADSQGMSETRYWSASYRLYIEKMLSIGLGASTMSYTKFVYTWQQAQQQGQNAKARFRKMFEFLKRDKRALAVQSSYDSRLPEAISWCQSLSRRLWVCDNRQRNWVYALR
jgi:hypothetical protein